MNFDPSKLSRIEIPATLSLLPLLILLVFYLAHRWWSVNWRPALPWLRTLRWIGWGLGSLLSLLSLTGGHFPVYGMAMTSFSVGLSIPESWVKRRLPA
jgi:hypothetical protein